MAIESISVLDLYKRQQADPKTLIIDVRTPEEFAEVRARGVLHLPGPNLSEDQLRSHTGNNRGQMIYFICRSGARSQAACQLAESLGYPNVVNVVGGTLAWVSAGLPTTSG